MIDEKKKALLIKLQALAERGVGGEKETAQHKLELLMKKYGIEEMDLSEEKKEDYDFKYRNEYEKKLLRQLFYKIVPDYMQHTYVYYCGKGCKSTYGIKCTKAQAMQIQIEYDFYRDLWEREEDFFFKAFVQKHRIFAESKCEENKDNVPMKEEDVHRMIAMMDGMKDESIHPMLQDKRNQ